MKEGRGGQEGGRRSFFHLKLKESDMNLDFFFYDILCSAERIKVQVWICTKKEFYNGQDYFFFL